MIRFSSKSRHTGPAQLGLMLLLGGVLAWPGGRAAAQEQEEGAGDPQESIRSFAECDYMDDVKTPAQYAKVCWFSKLPMSEICCERHVSILSDHNLWVDSGILTGDPERPLSVAELDHFYGFDDDRKFTPARKEANRKVILALLAARCLGTGLKVEMRESKILETCAESVPGLAAIDLSINHVDKRLSINNSPEGDEMEGSEERFRGEDSSSTLPFDTVKERWLVKQ